METDDDAASAGAQRKGVAGSYGHSLPRATEPVSAPARLAAPSAHSFGDGPGPAVSSPASARRRDPARCATFPQRHAAPVSHAPAASFCAWSAGGVGSASAVLERGSLSQYGGGTGAGGGGALPEFVGAGGGEGIFRVPPRAAMHPGRPPSLEVRPHPLRETQVGAFLRTLACDPRGRQLWAGAESGVRVWGLDEVFDGWPDGAARRRGDEDSAPFRESVPTPPALCAAVDGANRLVWTGHRDGRIRAWSMDIATDAGVGGGNAPLLKEALAWQAYGRTPVLAIVITSYGETLYLLDHLQLV